MRWHQDQYHKLINQIKLPKIKLFNKLFFFTLFLNFFLSDDLLFYYKQQNMNQFKWSSLRPQHQLAIPPSFQNESVHRQKKSKSKVSPVASKSFSESFLKQNSSRKIKNSELKKKQNYQSQSLDSKHKKLSEQDIFNQNRTEKHKALISAFDNKILKEAIKAKTQSNRIHLPFSSNFKYKNVQKQADSKSQQVLRLYQRTKNKSQTTLNQINNDEQQQKKMIKSISSTTKNDSMKNRMINSIDKKGKKGLVSHQNSLSERKRTSQNIQSKLNQFQLSHQHQYLKNRQGLNQAFKSNQENLRKSIQKDQKFQYQQNLEQRLQYQYAFRTKKGQNISNPNKVNQDSILVKQNISKKDLHIIAVADGHGPSGHLVSQFVVKNLSKLFSQQINSIIKFQNPSKKPQTDLIVEGTLFLPKIYDKIQNDLSCSQINAVNSGCTLVNVIIQKNDVLCANVGDSRAILARQLNKKNWELIYLSEDHKPCNQTEKKRILKCGGRIHSFKGEKGQSLGPLRVWLPNQNIQGLAMTRSFGDNISKSVGVTHKPEMIKVKIDEKDKFILVASDGVWEFISNQEILQLIAPYYKDKKLQEACDALLKMAYQKWTQGDDSVVDDISFVLVFLHC